VSGTPTTTHTYTNPGTYTVTLTITNQAGLTASTTSTVTVSAPPPPPPTQAAPTAGLQFVPVTPCRVADTRNATGPFGGPELSAGSTREFDIAQSACGIPSTAMAYSLNVTVVPSGPLGFLTLWPTGEMQPNVTTLNSDGRIKANAAIVGAGTNGGVNVYVSNATQVILDINGYFVPAGTASALAFYPITPCRVADTRNTTGPLGGPYISSGSSRSFPVLSSSCNIPATAQAYSVNVTAVPHKTLGYLSLWPTGETRPVVSTLNSYTGVVTANAAIVPAGTSGDVSVFVSNDSDVILDVNGYFAPPGTGGLSLYTGPCRTLDTRSGAGAFNGALVVNVEGSTCAPPSTAQAYVLNATVMPSGTLGFLTLWPNGGTRPVVSTLNAYDGAVTSNMAIVPTTNGSINAFATSPTNLILDIAGYFAP
ncbi:PKD domain-containing protein, partial [Alloacidobacterium sp.]|uniref:PKD domain-containing protein n=1 Tax=Alloacidobacterium sp. TaxID=2951999 RepID=UPI002D433DC6